MSDAINPAHYKRLPAEAIQIIEAAIDGAPSNKDAYLHGQILKYILRCWNKNGIEDLKKARWYLDRLIDSFDESIAEANETPIEPTRTSKRQPPAGYRLLGPAKDEPRIEGDSYWSLAIEEWIVLPSYKVEYANRDNWAACRKVEPVVKQSLTTEPPCIEVTGEPEAEWIDSEAEWIDAVWPQDWGKPARFWPNPIYQDEGTPDHKLWDLGTIAGYVSDGCRKWIIEMDGKISCQMYCQVKKRVGTLEQSPQPPDGWRWLERGEVIRKGDRCFSGDQWKDRKWAIEETYSIIHQKTIRRNRFEVGEKVIVKDNTEIWEVDSIVNGVYQLKNNQCRFASFPEHLAPYIEDAK